MDEVLKKAKEFMVGKAKATWDDYEYFKRLATGGEWIDDYDDFIQRLTNILKL